MTDSWPPEPAGRSAWSHPARERFAQICCALIPPEEVGARRDLVPAFCGAFVATLPPLLQLGLNVLITFLYVGGPLLLLGRPARFDLLGVDAQEKMLHRIVYSRLYPIRLLGTMLRSVAGLGILGDPEARRFLGVDPPQPPPAPLGPVRWNDDIREPGIRA